MDQSPTKFSEHTQGPDVGFILQRTNEGVPGEMADSRLGIKHVQDEPATCIVLERKEIPPKKTNKSKQLHPRVTSSDTGAD